MTATQTKMTKIDFMKAGAGAGLIAGFALFSSFFAIDQMLDIPTGTFYKTIGVTMGVDESLGIALGFLSHMGVAALIGSMYLLSSSIWRFFRLVTVPKAIMTGVLTGLIVFTLAFLPIHMFIMTPMMEVELIITDISDFDLKEQEALATLLFNSDKIYYHSLILHIIFGSIMGLMGGFFLHEEYEKVPRKGGIF
ncbi:hypothetical protein OAK01_02190 [Candidatus Nitrosopelagicus sp.]|nr:hypothetical protein [Candidatus Nitrosopelagicus sp.]